MFTVYVLKDKNGRFYKGMTNDLERRLVEHKSGKTKTTRSMDQIELVYQEQYETTKEARTRELYFKSAAGRRFIQKVLSTHSSAG